MRTPVAFFIFNRPQLAGRVFAEIARARPRLLFVVADGPRADRPGEAGLCAAARAVAERVDWDCEVRRLYADENMGCDGRLTTGMEWVFGQVGEAVILEDDCLPHPTFFPFCEELLERYRDDERVMCVGGRNSIHGERETPYSYFFTRILSCWGWATWRRAWRHFDYEMKLWPALRETSWLRDLLADDSLVEYFTFIFDRARARAGGVAAWDYAWAFSCWAQYGLEALPAANLVANIGFGDAATHTRDAASVLARVPVGAMEFPLRHPPYMAWDREADHLRYAKSAAARKGATGKEAAGKK